MLFQPPFCFNVKNTATNNSTSQVVTTTRNRPFPLAVSPSAAPSFPASPKTAQPLMAERSG